MNYSKFGEKFRSDCGIVELMDELGKALAENKDMRMLGGGNPAHIPEAQAIFKNALKDIIESDGQFETMVGDYDGPKGNTLFRKALSKLLNKEFDWDINENNIALTHGSQSSFFALFNMLAGTQPDGSFKRVLLPLAPEYIGYSDAGIEDDIFVACKPVIEKFEDNTFKYKIDFDAIEKIEDLAAVCVSRPTNPSGNVLTDDEIARLQDFAAKRNIPLLIDNAYGTPFPNIIFVDAKPVYNDNTVLCMSLSKLGLPGTRTGIVIANEDLIETLASMSSVISLAPGSVGPDIVRPMMESGEIISVSTDIVRKYYHGRAQEAQKVLHRELDGCDYYIHKSEGALFLWLWFPGLPISAQELYERLKENNVLVVPGHHFFPGLKEDWQHKKECIRMTYSSQPQDVEEGIKIIAQEVKKAFSQN